MSLFFDTRQGEDNDATILIVYVSRGEHVNYTRSILIINQVVEYIFNMYDKLNKSETVFSDTNLKLVYKLGST